MKRFFYKLSFLCACAAAMVSSADTHTWVGGSSSGGGWNTPSNWQNESGEAECPSEGDAVVLDVWSNVVTVSDSDYALFNSLKQVKLNAWSYEYDQGQELVLDFTEDRVVNPGIFGKGLLTVKGSNRIELSASDLTLNGTAYGKYGIFSIYNGGISVEDNATLVLEQAAACVYLGPLIVGEDATVVVCSNASTHVACVKGSGTIKNEGTVMRWFQISSGGVTMEEPAVFSGKFSGVMQVINYGAQAFTGTESDMTGYFYSCYGRGDNRTYGWTYATKLGNTGEASSLGSNWVLLGYGGNLGYIGTGGETCNKYFTFEARPDSGLNPQYIDAGPYGGVTFTGAFSFQNYGSAYNQRSLVLTGSNTTACTYSGALKLNELTDPTTGNVYSGYNYNMYIRKEGSGTWAFKKNGGSTFKGVFDVREGTLQFDSLAEAGTNCALGKSTSLTCEFTGKYDPSYDSPYAFRLGQTNDADAADAVFEFNGSSDVKSTTRQLLLVGDGHMRASGTNGAALVFGGVSAASGEKTLTIDGESTAENVLMNVADGDGTVSLVKDGSGTWCLDGVQSFSGDLAVNSGTLKVLGTRPHRYFRVTFWDNVFDHPNGCYVNEFGLYAADGTRINTNLVYNLPDGATWDASYSIKSGVAATLGAGEIAMDYISGVSSAGFWAYSKNPPSKLCDGTSSGTQFMCSLYDYKYTVSMRLPDDSKELAYVDFVQSNGNYDPHNEHPNARQTASAFRLEGSVDGERWTELVSTNTLADLVDGVYKVRGTGATWFFSDSAKTVTAYPADRELGDGEGLPLTTRAANVCTGVNPLANIRSASVAYGATLVVDGDGIESTLSKLVIDGANGAGTISGFNFAPNMTVDVTGIPSGTRHTTVPVDFSGVTNFDDVASWTFLVDGASSSRYMFGISKTALKINLRGFILSIR